MEERLTDRELAIEGYGTDYKGVLPDGTVTGVMSYDGRVFKHYVETGDNVWNHKRWEQDYTETPLRTALECLASEVVTPKMFTDECSYEGTFYERQPMESVGLTGWRYDYHDKMWFKRLVLRGEVTLPAPAVFSSYGNIYIEAGHEAEVLDLYANWAESNGTRYQSKTKGGAD